MKSSGKSSLLNLRELKAVTAKFSTRNREKKQSLFFAMLTHLVFFSLSSHQWTSCAAHSLLFLYSIYWTREHAVSIKRFVNIPHVMRKRGYPIQLKSSMWTPNIKVSLLFSLWSCVSCKNFGKSIFFSWLSFDMHEIPSFSFSFFFLFLGAKWKMSSSECFLDMPQKLEEKIPVTHSLFSSKQTPRQAANRVLLQPGNILG